MLKVKSKLKSGGCQEVNIMTIIALKVLANAVIWQEKNYKSENGGH